MLEDLQGNKRGQTSKAVGINDLGKVVGHYFTKRGQRVFRYVDETGIEDLGTLGGTDSWAHRINVFGDVVG